MGANFFKIYLYLYLPHLSCFFNIQSFLLIILTVPSIQSIYIAQGTCIAHSSFKNAPQLSISGPHRNLYKLWNALQHFIPICQVLVLKSLSERRVSASSKLGENWVHVQACWRQMFTSLCFYVKGDRCLDHLKEKTFIASFCEETSLVCTLVICMLIRRRNLLQNCQGERSNFYLSHVNVHIFTYPLQPKGIVGVYQRRKQIFQKKSWIIN